MARPYRSALAVPLKIIVYANLDLRYNVTVLPTMLRITMTKEKTYKFPKAIGACADKVYELRQKRLEQQKIVDAIEEEEKALKKHIIDNLPKSATTGVAGKIARVSAIQFEVPQVKDWDAFWKAFNKKTDIDLLSRSLNKAAINERLEAGKKVPGVEIYKDIKLSITKV